MRIIQYLIPRPIFIDEATLALNIFERNFISLTKPLFHLMSAPIGYLWVEKGVCLMIGKGEYQLRLFSLVVGVASVILFVRIAKYYLTFKGAILGVSIFSLLHSLIYYSSSLKQYAGDVFFMLLMWWLTIKLKESNFSNRDWWLVGIGGMVGCWFSYPLAIVMGALWVELIVKVKREEIFKLSLMTIGWGASILLEYIVVFHNLIHRSPLPSVWEKYILCFPLSVKQLTFIWKQLFDCPLELQKEVTSILILIGMVGFMRRGEKFLMLLFSILFSLVGSVLFKYPLRGRLILFLVPIFLILLGKGCEEVSKGKLGVVFWVVFCFLLINPTRDLMKNFPFQVWYHLEKRRIKMGVKQGVEYVQKHFKNGDWIYLGCGGYFLFSFYMKVKDFYPQTHIIGRCVEKIEKEVEKVIQKERVWLLFLETIYWEKEKEKEFLQKLTPYGKLFDKYTSGKTKIYLYEFSPTSFIHPPPTTTSPS